MEYQFERDSLKTQENLKLEYEKIQRGEFGLFLLLYQARFKLYFNDYANCVEVVEKLKIDFYLII
jgi:hypothetical protein